MDVLQDFYLTSVSGRVAYAQPDPLGPLADLVGTWKGARLQPDLAAVSRQPGPLPGVEQDHGDPGVRRNPG